LFDLLAVAFNAASSGVQITDPQTGVVLEQVGINHPRSSGVLQHPNGNTLDWGGNWLH